MKNKTKVGISKEMLDNISPENMMFVSDKEIENANPIVEMSDTKNLLCMSTQDFEFTTNQSINVMASIIYDVKKKTIETRGRWRFNNSGKKTAFTDRNPLPYSEENYKKKREDLDLIFTTIDNINIGIFETKPLDERFTVEFPPKTDMQVIIKAFNDSGKFDIGVPYKASV